MANRSYLYATDHIPTIEGSIEGLGISEHKTDVPLTHLILAGQGTRVVPSAIFDQEIGISADFDSGVALLRRFLSVLREAVVTDPEDFAEFADEVEAFVGAPSRRRRYFQLEVGEVMNLYADDLEAEVHVIAGRAAGTPSLVERLARGEEPGLMATLRTSWKSELVSRYSETLYFCLG